MRWHNDVLWYCCRFVSHGYGVVGKKDVFLTRHANYKKTYEKIGWQWSPWKVCFLCIYTL